MNQFAEKAPRYEYVSVAATSLPGRLRQGSGAHHEGKRLGVVKDMYTPVQGHLPLPLPPVLATQKEPKQGLELGAKQREGLSLLKASPCKS